MAVAHDTQTRFPATDTTGFDTTTGDRTFSHAADTGAKGAVVAICCTGTTAPVTGVLYGGRTMTLHATATDTTEAGRVDIYTLGDLTGLGGTQTITLQGCTAASKWCTASTVTAATSQTAFDNSGTVNTTTSTNPTVSFTAKANAMVYGAVHGGAAAPTSYAAGTGETVQHNADYGALSARTARSTSVAPGGSYTFDFSFGTSDDWCIAAVSIAELAVVPLNQVTERERPWSVVPDDGPALESYIAHAFSVRKVRSLGLVAEAEQPQAITSSQGAQNVPLTNTTEAETAQPVTPRKVRALGNAASGEQPQPLAIRKTRALGLVTEAEPAQPVTAGGPPVVVLLGLISEREMTQSATPNAAGTIDLGIAAESETAQALTVRKVRSLGLISEAETSGVLTRRKVRTIAAPAGEMPPPLPGDYTAPREHEHPQPITAVIGDVPAAPLGNATETETAQAVSRRKLVYLGQITAAEAAQPVTATKTLRLGQAVTAETAFGPARRKITQLPPATEFDTANGFAGQRADRLRLGLLTTGGTAITARTTGGSEPAHFTGGQPAVHATGGTALTARLSGGNEPAHHTGGTEQAHTTGGDPVLTNTGGLEVVLV